jgi:hypothetical protein
LFCHHKNIVLVVDGSRVAKPKADTIYRDVWNEYRPNNLQTWDDILFIILLLNEATTHTSIIWGKNWRPNPIYMDISIREDRDYMCIVIKILLSFFLIQNIHLIPILKKRVKNKVFVEASIYEVYIV